jgi:hypothetical protein
VTRMNSRLISATVSAIRPGSSGGGSSGVMGGIVLAYGFGLGRGGRADRERGQGQHDVPQQCGVETDLGMVGATRGRTCRVNAQVGGPIVSDA